MVFRCGLREGRSFRIFRPSDVSRPKHLASLDDHRPVSPRSIEGRANDRWPLSFRIESDRLEQTRIALWPSPKSNTSVNYGLLSLYTRRSRSFVIFFDISSYPENLSVFTTDQGIYSDISIKQRPSRSVDLDHSDSKRFLHFFTLPVLSYAGFCSRTLSVTLEERRERIAQEGEKRTGKVARRRSSSAKDQVTTPHVSTCDPNQLVLASRSAVILSLDLRTSVESRYPSLWEPTR